MFSFRFGAAVVAAIVAVNIAIGETPWDSAYVRRRPGASSYVAEAGGALAAGNLIGGGSAFVLGIMLVSFADLPSDPQFGGLGALGAFLTGAAAGAALGYPFGCALGTATVGSWMDCDGNTGLAYAGAYLGLPVGIGLVWLGALAQTPGLAIPLYVAGGLAPPAGAVIGYNLFAPKERLPTYFGARLSPPALTFCTRSGLDRQTYYALDCRLVTVGF